MSDQAKEMGKIAHSLGLHQEFEASGTRFHAESHTRQRKPGGRNPQNRAGGDKRQGSRGGKPKRNRSNSSNRNRKNGRQRSL
jgi:hypothetical protein